MKIDLMKLQNGSDVRGIASEGVAGENVNLTEEAAAAIAKSYARWLSKKCAKPASELKIGIGRDARITGKKLAAASACGIISAGAKTVDCGLATTPAMFMSIIFDRTKFDGAVMITASHLPFNRNGMKFFCADGGLEHDDIAEILLGAKNLSAEISENPFADSVDLISIYSAHLRSSICRELNSTEEKKPLSGLKIVVDAGNGDAGFFVEKVLVPLGADTSGSQFLEPDGNFPNHIPNPENKKAMESVREATVKNGADLGLIFDTDVDRMSAVFSSGVEANRDAIIALVAAILAEEYPGGTVVTDSVTSDRLTFFLEQKLGMHHFRFMRGYKNVIDKCRELNENGIVSPLAMETSGHGALKDNFYLDDGAFLAVKLVAALAKNFARGKKLESFIDGLPCAGVEDEFRFRICDENFRDYGKKVLDEFKLRAEKKGLDLPENFEGVRISFHGEISGWLLLRLSLHDPVMPLNVEGRTQKDRDEIVKIAGELLTGFEKLDVNGF
jgi:phosphomannomutase